MTKINSDDRFIRWHSSLRNQVSFSNNLLLSISIGIIGYVFNLMLNDSIILKSSNKCWIEIGLIITLLSIIFGVLTNLTRIVDFRLTLEKIKKELKQETDIAKVKALSKTFGNITWFLFYCQIGTFFLGIICLCLTLIILI